MKKAIIKFFVWLIILTGIGSTVFFFGWLQFAVPAGSYGVMLSKSGGYHNQPVMHGEFSWRWERLIPTNSKIIILNLKPQTVEYKTVGVLDLSDKFSAITEKKYDFSWKWGITVSASVNPKNLISIVKQQNVSLQSDLNKYLNDKVIESTQSCANEFIQYYLETPEEYGKAKFYYGELQKKILNDLQKKLGDNILIHSVELSDDFNLPDLKLYHLFRDAYIAYEREQQKALIALSTERGQKEALQRFSMNYLKDWGEILKQYPQLVDFLAVARNDASETLKALRELKLNAKNESKETTTE